MCYKLTNYKFVQYLDELPIIIIHIHIKFMQKSVALLIILI